MNTEMVMSAAYGVSARYAPKPVAAPLPPLKPRNTGKTWPTTARVAAAGKAA